MVSSTIEDLNAFLPVQYGALWPAATILIPVIGILVVVFLGKYGPNAYRYVRGLFEQYKTYPGDIGNQR